MALGTRDIACLRNDLLSFLTDTCTVRRRSFVTDDYGNAKETWTDSTTTYPCRFDLLERTEGVFGGYFGEREDSKVWYTVFFEYNVDVEPGDKLVKGGKQFEVLQTSGFETLNIMKSANVVAMQGDTE